MKVSDAIKNRHSVRAFLNNPVSTELIKELLEQSSRCPSGGNLQPWKIYVINEASMKDFLNFSLNGLNRKLLLTIFILEILKSPTKLLAKK